MEQTDPRDLLKNIAKIFEKLKIPYFVAGGMAVLIWGRPRFTADIDIVVEIKPSDVDDLVKALRELGESGYIDDETVNEIVRNGGEFNFIDGTTGVKIDFWVSSNDEFDLSRFERKVAKEINGQRVYFSSPEDLILIKLKWFEESGSNRHLEDAESIVKISGEELDIGYLKEWAEKLRVIDAFIKLLA